MHSSKFEGNGKKFVKGGNSENKNCSKSNMDFAMYLLLSNACITD